jgi:hypothetical protein
MTYNIDEYSRVEALCEGTPENYLVGLTEITVRRILETDNPCDALALYSFYCYVAKWQRNNSAWAVASYCMKHLKIGKDRFHSAKQTLLDLELIEDDPRYDHEKGRMDRWYVRVRHLSGATLRKSYSTEIPQGREPAYSNQRHKIELPESNKKKPSTIKYPTKAEADAAANGAGAQIGKADALSSRPPNSVSTRTPFRAPKSPPTKPADISDETWAAWCDLRKAKRAAVTAPVLAMLRKEADKAGWSLNSAMEECVLRNWQGFKADWLQRVHKQESQTSLL